MRILIFGASGLIGSNLFAYLSKINEIYVMGTHRNHAATSDRLFFFDYGVSDITDLLKSTRPDFVVNALGITKHVQDVENITKLIKVNSVFPHELAEICEKSRAKLIHISTDCVFSGNKGNYTEHDIPDAQDFYGRSKILGEVTYGTNLTVRISTIGRELNTKHGLLEWFLDQKNNCMGYSKAVFTGLPSLYFASILHGYLLKNSNISGLYHISSQPINKFDLLKKLAIFYNKNIEIIENNSLIVDRSLNSDNFSSLTGYRVPSWDSLLQKDWF